MRYQNASDLRTDVQRLKRDRDSGRKTAQAVSEPARIKSLAVLPFANLSADKENEYFSDGLAEDIINALTRLPGLRVIARTSSFSFRGKDVDVREIGARLNVESILEGSLRKAGNRIRVTAQLVSAADGSRHWSERYDREMTDVFAIQDEICQAIIDKLRVELAAGRVDQARKLLEELQDLAQKAYVSPWSFGLIYAGLGDIDRGFDWLDKAVDEHNPLMLHIDIEPTYDPLRSHPRYQALLRKMNLEP